MLPYLCDPRHREMSKARGDDPDKLIETYAWAINEVVAEKPDDMMVAMHMCRGNMNAFWGGEGGYAPVAEIAFNMPNVDAFLLEYDTPRAGDFAPLRHVPKGKQVLLGIVSTKDPKLESADELKRRIDDAAKYIRARATRHLPAMRLLDQRVRHRIHGRRREAQDRDDGRCVEGHLGLSATARRPRTSP